MASHVKIIGSLVNTRKINNLKGYLHTIPPNAGENMDTFKKQAKTISFEGTGTL